MQVIPYKTEMIIQGNDLWAALDSSLPKLEEKSIVVVTSKIVSICEGCAIKDDGAVTKAELAKKEADMYFTNAQTVRYDVALTIKYNILIANAGIDHSNGNGYFILWPKDPMLSARRIWEYLKSRDNLKELGVIISDSHIIPLRWGSQGFGLAWCGFEALNSYIGKPDIFGQLLKITNLAIIDGLAATAVVTMGEGNEQTPLAVITDILFVHFQDRPPSQSEIDALKISLVDDMYAPLLTSVDWQKNKT